MNLFIVTMRWKRKCAHWFSSSVDRSFFEEKIETAEFDEKNYPNQKEAEFIWSVNSSVWMFDKQEEQNLVRTNKMPNLYSLKNANFYDYHSKIYETVEK